MTVEAVPTSVTTSQSNPSVLTAPLNAPVPVDTLLNNSSVVANLQAQIDALAARVTALENA